MSELTPEEKVSFREVLKSYVLKREKQLQEIRVLEFIIAHLEEEWRKEHPWEYEQEQAAAAPAKETKVVPTIEEMSGLLSKECAEQIMKDINK